MKIEFNQDLTFLLDLLPVFSDKQFRDISFQKSIKNLLLSNRVFNEFYGNVINGLEENKFQIIDDFPINDQLLLSFATCFGFVSEPYQSTSSVLVQNINYNPLTDSVVSTFHTDDSGWRKSSRFVFLLVVKPDQFQDGRTKILKAQNLIDNLLNSGRQDLLNFLVTYEFPFKEAGNQKQSFFLDNVISKDDTGTYKIRYLFETIDDGRKVQEISEDANKLLLDFHTILNNIQPSFDDLLRSGSLIIIDNYSAMHAKSSMTESSTRSIKRVKVFEN